MLLFVLSFILIFVASYFLSAILAKDDTTKGILYVFIIAFSQIVLTTEILSIFHYIYRLQFLCFNLFFCILFFILWIRCGKPILKFDFHHFLKRVYNSCKLDKSLFLLILGWLFFIFVTTWLVIFLPSTSGDAYCYHVVRCYDWVINHSLAHFETADIRINAFPVNSEILYMWVILFTQKQLFLGVFTFVGYLMFLISSYNIFKYIGFSTRRTLWTLIVVSSFASVVVMASGTETDLIISGLITTSIYLFINALKNKSDNVILFMSSLAYALAIGVKTPAIICIPAIGCLFLYLSFKYKDKYSLLKFIGFGVVAFLLFSSYNYILNFLHYENIMGGKGSISVHRNLWGIKGFVANLIRHLFLLIDFSGIKVPSSFVESFMHVEQRVLRIFHLSHVPIGIYSGKFFFNGTLLEPGMGCGLLSFLLVIPFSFLSLIAPIFRRNRIVEAQFVFAVVFFINLIILSAMVAFMTFNTRFITSFLLISAPMFAGSYFRSNKNLLKVIYIFIMLFYFTVISTHLWGRPFFKLMKAMKNEGIVRVRSGITCGKYDKRDKSLDEWCNISALIDSKFGDKKYKILFMPNFSEYIIYVKNKKLKGYNYDFINAEHLNKINVDGYDIIILPITGQAFTEFDKYSPDKIDYHFSVNDESKSIFHYPIDWNAECLCYYKNLDEPISKELGNENSIPYLKVCLLTSNFYNNHPFAMGYRTDKYLFLLNTNTFPEFKANKY